MIPAEVLFDEKLDHRDLRVYAAMVYFRDEDRGQTGERRLAGACRIDRRSLKKARETLVARGHIEVSNEGLDRRKYKLLHPCFQSTPKAVSVTASVDAPKVKRTLISCPLCHVRCRQILKVGWCRRCGTDKRMEKIAARVVETRIAQEKSA